MSGARASRLTALPLRLLLGPVGDLRCKVGVAAGRRVALALATTAVLGGCATAAEVGGDGAAGGDGLCAATVGAAFPEVVDAVVEDAGGGVYRVVVTVCSGYDSVERYADAWRVVGPDGAVLGVRELLHDHASEQPFTRSLGGVEIPDGVDSVVIEGRDLVNGWGGGTVEVPVP